MPSDPPDPLRGDLWRTSLPLFALRVSCGLWRPYPHLVAIARRVQDAVVRGGARIIVNMPPRHGKSELIAHWLPLWYLHLNPSARVVLASYSAHLAEGWALSIRRDIGERRRLLGLTVRSGRHERDRMDSFLVDPSPRGWQPRQPGSLLAVGVGGGLTGQGADLLIVDDPHKNDQEARSESAQRETRRWWNRVAMTRLQRGGNVVVVMTRWNERDLTGYLLESGEAWEHVVIPAIAREGDPLGRAEGEALCPELKPLSELIALRDSESGVGSAAFATMYQQDPTPEEDAVFRREWFPRFDAWPDPDTFDGVIQSWDLTFGSESETASYVVGQVYGVRGAHAWLLREWRKRAPFGWMVEAVKEALKEYPQTDAVLMEDKAFGPAIKQTLEVPRLVMVTPGGRSKLTRAMAVAPMVEAGNLHLPSAALAPWVNDWLDEVTRFPRANRDDRVDCLSYALERVRSQADRKVIHLARFGQPAGG